MLLTQARCSGVAEVLLVEDHTCPLPALTSWYTMDALVTVFPVPGGPVPITDGFAQLGNCEFKPASSN